MFQGCHAKSAITTTAIAAAARRYARPESTFTFPMLWAIVGLVLAGGGAALGSMRARRSKGGTYDAQLYFMTAVSHRRFSLLSIGFAALFAFLGAFPIVPAWTVLAAYVVLLVLYLSSFVRGAVGEDE